MRQAAPRWYKGSPLRYVVQARPYEMSHSNLTTVSPDKGAGLLGLDMYHQPSDFMARATEVVDKCRLLRHKVSSLPCLPACDILTASLILRR